MSNNHTAEIIPFPGKVKKTPAEMLEDIKVMDDMTFDRVFQSIEYMSNVITTNLVNLGYPSASDTEAIKDLCLVFETVKSLIGKYHGLEHPFQNFAEENFIIDENNVVLCTYGQENESEQETDDT